MATAIEPEVGFRTRRRHYDDVNATLGTWPSRPGVVGAGIAGAGVALLFGAWAALIIRLGLRP
jgi:hypothetical protein